MQSPLVETFRTKEDQQAMLIALLLIFLIGVKCFMLFTPLQQIALKQKNTTHASSAKFAIADYPKIWLPLLKVVLK